VIAEQILSELVVAQQSTVAEHCHNLVSSACDLVNPAERPSGHHMAVPQLSFALVQSALSEHVSSVREPACLRRAAAWQLRPSTWLRLLLVPSHGPPRGAGCRESPVVGASRLLPAQNCI